MKETQSYKEDDLKYKSFKVTEKELKILSDYFDYEFNENGTSLNCMYDQNNNLLAVQVIEESTWDLTETEVKELFGSDAECLK